MSIDNCKYSFAQLATDVFPKYMEVLRSGFDSPTPMSVFPEKETGIANILRNLNLEADFQGCYVLLNNSRPVYVGISQSVIQRLRQHVRGTTQFDGAWLISVDFDIVSFSVPRVPYDISTISRLPLIDWLNPDWIDFHSWHLPVLKYGYVLLMFAHFGASFNVFDDDNLCLYKYLVINRN